MKVFPLLRISFVLLCLSFIAAAPRSEAQDSGTSVAFSRAAHLRRGINTSMWFAQSPRDYSPQHLTTYTTDADFHLIQALGFDHIRLSIDPVPLLKPPLTNGLNPGHLKLLDDAIHEILANHLNVVLDIHPEDDYKRTLRTEPEAQQAFVRFWTTFAQRYAATDPEHVFFEVLNEPEVNDPDLWANIEGRAVPAIRAAAPRHTIIATAGRYSGLRDLLRLQPLSDRNVIYTFHDYEPMAFTHQGAGWTMPEVKGLSRIPYPSTPASIADRLPEESSLADQFWLNEYGLDRWDANRIASEIAYARKWSEQYHVPVWCGEFGVFRDHVDPTARAAWLHDMRVALESNGLGWAMWDYRANFGIARDVNGKRIADPLIVNALGLNPVP